MNYSANDQQAALARREELVIQELPDEVLVYDLKRHKAHCLNQTAAFVWNHCDGQKTAAEIAALMEKEWGKPVNEDVVWLALRQLGKADLLQQQVVRPGGGMNLSRRQAMRKLGLAAALSLPVVMSIAAPTAAALASVPAECQACIKKTTGSAACPNVCNEFVTGSCFNNAGCGGGGFLATTTCAGCFINFATPGDQSWRAPN